VKRFISISICILLIFNLFIPSTFAADRENEMFEKVLADVKPRIPDTSGFPEFDSNIRTENGKVIYSFNWGGEAHRSMYLSALESGIIIEYGFFEEIRNAPPPAGFDRIPTEEAVRKTQVLLNKLNPAIAGKLFVEAYEGPESFNADSLYFMVVHKEGGVPVQGDTGRVTVDVNAEKITSFRMKYTEGLKYVSPHDILSKDAAKSAFAEELGLTLGYRTYKDYQKRTVKVFTTYSDENGTTYLDANTGKATEIQLYNDLFFSKNESASDMITGSGSSSGNFSEAESKELENIGGILSVSAAEKLLRSNPILNITGDYAVEETGLRKVVYSENSYIRTVVFRATKPDKSAFIHIDIDAATGEVLSYSNFSGTASGKKLTAAQLKDAADKILAELGGDKAAEFKMNEHDGADGYFTYTRYVNEIPVFGDTVSVEVSTDAAALISYRMNYTETEFPSTAKAITHTEACEKFFSHTDYIPLYIPQKTDADLMYPDTTTLVFTPDVSGILIDAVNGNRITAQGTLYEEAAVFEDYTDISGHYAEEKILALHRFGIGFSGNMFYPDRQISQAEFIELSQQAIGNVLSVSDLKSIPHNVLTRIEATRLICRALKIDKYAEIEGIYNCPFEDVESGKGYVSLLWGLGIINGTSKNQFSPDDGLTRAQAAIILYNTMRTL